MDNYGLELVGMPLLEKAYLKADSISSPAVNPLAERIKQMEEERMIYRPFEIKRVIFNDPVTVVLWADGTKTKVRAQKGDTFNKETGLAMCIAKKVFGNVGSFNEVFKEWIPEYGKPEVTVYVEKSGKVVCHEPTGEIRNLSQKEAKVVKARFKRK